MHNMSSNHEAENKSHLTHSSLTRCVPPVHLFVWMIDYNCDVSFAPSRLPRVQFSDSFSFCLCLSTAIFSSHITPDIYQCKWAVKQNAQIFLTQPPIVCELKHFISAKNYSADFGDKKDIKTQWLQKSALLDTGPSLSFWANTSSFSNYISFVASCSLSLISNVAWKR